MRRKICIGLLLLLFFPIVVGAKPQEITLKVNDKVVHSDVPLFIKNGRTYVPARFVGEALGMDVSFEYGSLGGDEHSLFVYLQGKNGRVVEINGFGVFADGINFSAYDENALPFETVKDRTFVPIRFIAEALHMDITWTQETKTVGLKSNHNTEDYTLVLGKDLDEDFQYIFAPSKIYKIQYNGEKYILIPSNLTIGEFYDKKIFPNFENKYEEITKSEEYLFGHNCYFLYPDKKVIHGISCN